jgi:GDPmannose 4,6-dehydratase
MFGGSLGPQNEQSSFSPQTPYGISKLQAHKACSFYRDKYGMFISSGFLFNHESPRRSELFVTRKITQTAALIHSGLASTLELGDLNASRDWGYAPDYVFAMWKMLQIDSPKDFVISTGKSKTVESFVEEAFSFFDLDWREYTRINPAFLRPTTVSAIQGDSTRASIELGWVPSVLPSELIELMCREEMRRIAGHAIDLPQSSLWKTLLG